MLPPLDLAGYTQCHFFAGVGVWSYALRRAGWPDSRPVWTGSCPCQPFSAAGKGNGFADERHLWPAWLHLIGQRNPFVVFGEQVSSKDADVWVDLVQTDMEALAYAFGAVPFPSAGVGAPHIRDRLYWLADSNKEQRGRRADSEGLQSNGTAVERNEGDRIVKSNSAAYGLDNTNDAGLEGFGGGYQAEGGRFGEVRPTSPASKSCREFPQGVGAMQTERRPTGPVNGRWSDADWLFCRDGKWRPVEPGTFPLANGAPARVGRLRAYGNAINAEAAEAVIRAYMECQP